MLRAFYNAQGKIRGAGAGRGVVGQGNGAQNETQYTWNPSDKGTGITLSNGNLTMVDTTANGFSVRSTGSYRNTGKYYAEFKLTNTTVTFCKFGFANSSFVLTQSLGGNANAGCIQGGGTSNYNAAAGAQSLAAFAANDVMMMAIDIGGQKVWWGKNGTWAGSPSAGTGAWYSSFTVSTGLLLVSAGLNNTGGTIRTTSAEFSYSPPSGFSSWGSA